MKHNSVVLHVHMVGPVFSQTATVKAKLGYTERDLKSGNAEDAVMKAILYTASHLILVSTIFVF